MNKIQIFAGARQICKAYGAKMVFVRAELPIVCELPTNNGEVVRCFSEELLNYLGLYSEVEGNKVTFSLV